MSGNPQVRVSTDRDVCVGAGQCVLAAPEVFDQDDDGIVLLLVAEPEEQLLDEVDAAAAACPARAIQLTNL